MEQHKLNHGGRHQPQRDDLRAVSSSSLWREALEQIRPEEACCRKPLHCGSVPSCVNSRPHRLQHATLLCPQAPLEFTQMHVH